MKKLNPQIERRMFLQGLLGTGSASLLRTASVGGILETLIRGSISNVYAESASKPPRTFVDFHVPSGFAGWCFYQPLNPYAGQSVISNASCANNWVNGAPVYSTVSLTSNGETINMPHVWGASIPRSAARGGGTVPMSSLLRNSLFVRGIQYPVNSHELNAIATQRPELGSPSIEGMLGDRTSGVDVPFPVIMAGEDYFAKHAYSAKQAVPKTLDLSPAPYFPSTANPLSDLLNTFATSSSMRQMLSRRNVFNELYQSAVSAVVNDLKASKGVGSENLFSTGTSAENMFSRNFGNLTDVYNNLVSKYRDLISRCSDVSDVLTSAIAPPQNSLYRRYERTVAEVNRYITNSDLRTTILPSTIAVGLAESFAVAEFLIQENLSKAISLNLGWFGVALKGFNYTVSSGIANDASFDQHTTGVGVAIPVNIFYAKAFGACLYEFTQRLQEMNKFDSTFIKIGSEFSRSPRNDGGGSDHGFEAQCFMGMSGAIQTPYVLGNILGDYDPNGGDYRGTWGRGSTIQHEGSDSTILQAGHYASTVSAILRIPSPTPSFESLVEENTSEKIVPKVSRGQTRDR